MAKFFKSAWFKCITLLLIVAVFSGGMLAVLNDAWAVSPEERTMRSIKKIYGEEKEFTTLLDVDDPTRTDDAWVDSKKTAEISKIYVVGDQTANAYDMLFKTTGGDGYKNGTITLWVKVVFSTGKNPRIDKVILETYQKQTLMSKLGGDYYGKFLVDVTEAYADGGFTTGSYGGISNPVSGATMSGNAGCNAVNGVLECIENTGWEIA